jgi:hypothetical protein
VRHITARRDRQHRPGAASAMTFRASTMRPALSGQCRTQGVSSRRPGGTRWLGHQVESPGDGESVLSFPRGGRQFRSASLQKERFAAFAAFSIARASSRAWHGQMTNMGLSGSSDSASQMTTSSSPDRSNRSTASGGNSIDVRIRFSCFAFITKRGKEIRADTRLSRRPT